MAEKIERQRKRGLPYGDRVRDLRDAAGLSQQEAADLTGVSVGAWSKYERGEVGVPRTSWLSFTRGLGVTDDWKPGDPVPTTGK